MIAQAFASTQTRSRGDAAAAAVGCGEQLQGKAKAGGGASVASQQGGGAGVAGSGRSQAPHVESSARVAPRASGARQLVYRSSLHCLTETIRHEGLLAMWKGLAPTYMRIAPWTAFFFVSFEQLSIAVTGTTMPTR